MNSGVVLSNMPGAPNLAITLSNTSGTFDGRYLIPKDMPLIGGMSLVLDPIWFGMTVNTLFYAMLNLARGLRHVRAAPASPRPPGPLRPVRIRPRRAGDVPRVRHRRSIGGAAFVTTLRVTAHSAKRRR